MKLTRAIRNKLGTLAEAANQTVAEVIRARGGTAVNVREAGPWANMSLEETAKAALQRDRTAGKAIKIAKEARRLGHKYGGNST